MGHWPAWSPPQNGQLGFLGLGESPEVLGESVHNGVHDGRISSFESRIERLEVVSARLLELEFLLKRRNEIT